MYTEENLKNRKDFWINSFDPTQYKEYPDFWEILKVLSEIDVEKNIKGIEEGSEVRIGKVSFSKSLDDFMTMLDFEEINDVGTVVVIASYQTERGIITSQPIILPDVHTISPETSMVPLFDAFTNEQVANVAIKTDVDLYGLTFQELEWCLDKHYAKLHGLKWRRSYC